MRRYFKEAFQRHDDAEEQLIYYYAQHLTTSARHQCTTNSLITHSLPASPLCEHVSWCFACSLGRFWAKLNLLSLLWAMRKARKRAHESLRAGSITLKSGLRMSRFFDTNFSQHSSSSFTDPSSLLAVMMNLSLPFLFTYVLVADMVVNCLPFPMHKGEEM